MQGSNEYHVELVKSGSWHRTTASSEAATFYGFDVIEPRPESFRMWNRRPTAMPLQPFPHTAGPTKVRIEGYAVGFFHDVLLVRNVAEYMHRMFGPVQQIKLCLEVGFIPVVDVTFYSHASALKAAVFSVRLYLIKRPRSC